MVTFCLFSELIDWHDAQKNEIIENSKLIKRILVFVKS